MGLDVETENTLWQAIDVLEAQEYLTNMRLGMYTKFKEGVYKEDHRVMNKKAYPGNIYKKPSISLEEFIKKTSGGLGG